MLYAEDVCMLYVAEDVYAVCCGGSVPSIWVYDTHTLIHTCMIHTPSYTHSYTHPHTHIHMCMHRARRFGDTSISSHSHIAELVARNSALTEELGVLQSMYNDLTREMSGLRNAHASCHCNGAVAGNSHRGFPCVGQRQLANLLKLYPYLGKTRALRRGVVHNQLARGNKSRVQFSHQAMLRIKVGFQQRYDCEDHPLYPKLLEMRSLVDGPPPEVGSLINMDNMGRARVLGVGSFRNWQHWLDFPLRGKGGAGLYTQANPAPLRHGKQRPKGRFACEEVLSVRGCSMEAFERGEIYFVALRFE